MQDRTDEHNESLTLFLETVQQTVLDKPVTESTETDSLLALLKKFQSDSFSNFIAHAKKKYDRNKYIEISVPHGKGEAFFAALKNAPPHLKIKLSLDIFPQKQGTIGPMDLQDLYAFHAALREGNMPVDFSLLLNNCSHYLPMALANALMANKTKPGFALDFGDRGRFDSTKCAALANAMRHNTSIESIAYRGIMEHAETVRHCLSRNTLLKQYPEHEWQIKHISAQLGMYVPSNPQDEMSLSSSQPFSMFSVIKPPKVLRAYYRDAQAIILQRFQESFKQPNAAVAEPAEAHDITKQEVMGSYYTSLLPQYEKTGILSESAHKSDGTLLLCAVLLKREIATFRALLDQNPQSINQVNEFGDSALLVAVSRGYTEIAAFLLENGADPSQRTKYGYSSLFIATHRRQADMISLLVRYGADTSAARLQNGDTLFHYAAEHNYVSVIDALLARERDAVNTQNENGETALMRAASQGHLAAVKYLVNEGGADITIRRTVDSATAFDLAKAKIRCVAHFLFKKQRKLNGKKATLRIAFDCAGDEVNYQTLTLHGHETFGWLLHKIKNEYATCAEMTTRDIVIIASSFSGRAFYPANQSYLMEKIEHYFKDRSVIYAYSHSDTYQSQHTPANPEYKDISARVEYDRIENKLFSEDWKSIKKTARFFTNTHTSHLLFKLPNDIKTKIVTSVAEIMPADVARDLANLYMKNM